MKELPYFKFFVAEYLQGDITLLTMQAQGLFINICSHYWNKQGCIKLSYLKKRLNTANEDMFNELIENKLIKINMSKDSVKISFLDEQMSELENEYIKNSENGKKGVEAKRLKREHVTNEAQDKPPLSPPSQPLKHLDKDLDKEKEKINIIQEESAERNHYKKLKPYNECKFNEDETDPQKILISIHGHIATEHFVETLNRFNRNKSDMFNDITRPEDFKMIIINIKQYLDIDNQPIDK